jgi:hypothetical protein
MILNLAMTIKAMRFERKKLFKTEMHTESIPNYLSSPQEPSNAQGGP